MSVVLSAATAAGAELVLAEPIEAGSLVYLRRAYESWGGGAVLGRRPTVLYRPDEFTEGRSPARRREGDDGETSVRRDWSSGPMHLTVSTDPGPVVVEIDADQARPLVIPYRGSLRLRANAAGTWEYRLDVREIGEPAQARDRVYHLTRPLTVSPSAQVIPTGAVAFEFLAPGGTSFFCDFTIGGATLTLAAAVGQVVPLLNASALSLRFSASGCIRWHVELG